MSKPNPNVPQGLEKEGAKEKGSKGLMETLRAHKLARILGAGPLLAPPAAAITAAAIVGAPTSADAQHSRAEEDEDDEDEVEEKKKGGHGEGKGEWAARKAKEAALAAARKAKDAALAAARKAKDAALAAAAGTTTTTTSTESTPELKSNESPLEFKPETKLIIEASLASACKKLDIDLAQCTAKDLAALEALKQRITEGLENMKEPDSTTNGWVWIIDMILVGLLGLEAFRNHRLRKRIEALEADAVWQQTYAESLGADPKKPEEAFDLLFDKITEKLAEKDPDE